MQIAHFSLLRASARLEQARQRQSNPDEDVAEERRQVQDSVRCCPWACLSLPGLPCAAYGS